MSEGPAGLYLHIPFCARVCPYCDFAVRTGDDARRRRFADHLVAEIELWRGYPLELDTIYFGGGTPSSLAPEELARIVEAARAALRFAPGTRTFLEANPEDVSATRVEAWRRLGADTLSLGVQSLDPRALAFLGRQHAPDDALLSVELGRAAGFRTVSIDMIYGLPGQRADDWRRDLERAVVLGADHVSCYQLTIHERTRFGLLARRGRLEELPVDDQADLFRLTHRFLNDAGYEGYEVSQFATGPEHRSRHNQKYWNHTPYLGLGPSAHSFEPPRRWWNLRRTDAWQEQVAARRRPVEGSETLDAQALVLEALMTGLRTYAGVDLDRLARRFGIDLRPANRELIEQLERRGLLTVEDPRIVPTFDGLAIADSLPPLFEI